MWKYHGHRFNTSKMALQKRDNHFWDTMYTLIYLSIHLFTSLYIYLTVYPPHLGLSESKISQGSLSWWNGLAQIENPCSSPSISLPVKQNLPVYSPSCIPFHISISLIHLLSTPLSPKAPIKEASLLSLRLGDRAFKQMGLLLERPPWQASPSCRPQEGSLSWGTPIGDTSWQSGLSQRRNVRHLYI